MTIRKWDFETLVNNPGPSLSSAPQVTTYGSDGNFVVVWEDSVGASIVMQLYDAAGTKIGAQIVIDASASAPSVATMSDGSFVVAFSDAGGFDLGYRRFDATGAAIDASTRTLALAGEEGFVQVIANGNNFTFVFREGVAQDIQGQTFTLADGNVSGGAFGIGFGANNLQDPSITALRDGSGDLVAVWRNAVTGNIQHQRLNSNGTLDGTVSNVTSAPSSAAEPEVTALANGGYVVTWRDTNQPFPDTTSSAVRARVFNATGVAVGNEFTVNTIAAGGQSTPVPVALKSGNFVIVYISAQTLCGQMFDPSGNRIGTEFTINSASQNIRQAPDVTELGDGRIVVVWTDTSGQFLDDDSGMTIRRQIIDPRDGVVTGTTGNDKLFGNNYLSDEINGLGGNDTLNGLGGADVMIGGEGDDTYIVDNAGDITSESNNIGTDTVIASVSFALAANVEKLTLSGSAALNATGNSAVNTLTGNAGANVLNGGASGDTMLGLAGNDTYVVDNALDTVSEAGGAGIDTVVSSINFSLVNSARVIGLIEKLTLTGTALAGTGNNLANTITGNASANTLIGNAGNDIIVGNAGNDTINGGAGIDTLTGSAGSDFFVFNAPRSSANRDIVKDFSAPLDTMRLENAVFSGIGGNGVLNAAFFHAGVAAADANDRIIYNRATGVVTYDANGVAAGDTVIIATLLNKPVLTNADFVVI